MEYRDELFMKLTEQADGIIDTLPSFARKFFNHIQQEGMSPRTKLQYAYDMQRFFAYLENGGFKGMNHASATAADVLDKLTIDDIQEYFASLDYHMVTTKYGKTEKRPSSNSIKARRVSCLRSFYRYYFKIGEIQNNLADLMDVPKIPEKKIVTMVKEDVARILKAVQNVDGLSESDLKRHKKIMSRDLAIMMLFLGTGIRVSELVGINVSDVDYYNASILVTRKGGDQDEVFFGPEVEDALGQYQNGGGRDGLLGSTRDEPAFFLSMQHKRLSVRAVEILIKGYAQKAGLNIKLTPHGLRRTFGTNLYEQTGDIYLVADALHHSSVETTKKHYAKMSTEHKRIAAKQSSTLFIKDHENNEEN